MEMHLQRRCRQFEVSCPICFDDLGSLLNAQMHRCASLREPPAFFADLQFGDSEDISERMRVFRKHKKEMRLAAQQSDKPSSDEQVVMEQSDCTLEAARAALAKHDGDIVSSIIFLTI